MFIAANAEVGKKRRMMYSFSWFNDVLDVLTTNVIGFALWEFKGDFDILNSNRADVKYENWYGHQLDKKLLTLLQSK